MTRELLQDLLQLSTMSLVSPHLTPSDLSATLHLAQNAPTLLARAPSGSAVSPIALLASSETPETWTNLEKLLIACLQTGDDKSAHLALERLTQRFGADNERVMGLRGLYQEAVAKDIPDLQKVVEEYNKILGDNPMNVPIHKRRIALMRSLKLDEDAATALVHFLGSFPADFEAWSELSDVYWSLGLASQAIFALEEALLGAPNAWNLHARLGEMEYMAALSEEDNTTARGKLLSQSVRRFGRSIELCDNYLRGYYGLAMATARLMDANSTLKDSSQVDISQPTVQKLHDVAIQKLAEIVALWPKRPGPGINESEIIAAQQLLDANKK